MSIGPNVDVSLKVFVGRPAELERNSMTSKLMEDPRIDPRIKAMFGSADPLILPNVSSREELLAQENSNTADVRAANLQLLIDAMGSEEVASSAGLIPRTACFTYQPHPTYAVTGKEVLVRINYVGC